MRSRILTGAVVGLALCMAVGAFAREAPKRSARPMRDWSPGQYLPPSDGGAICDGSPIASFNEAAVDTYCIVWYTFESMAWQGWTRVDNTAQKGTYFHVDDFAGLGGGDFGRLGAIEGTKSMWCGVRPSTSDPYLCSWLSAPGYGNKWDQTLQSVALGVTGLLTVSFHGVFDVEPGYDFVIVENTDLHGSFQPVVEYTGICDTIAIVRIPLQVAHTKLRFRFTSDGVWSDEDGLWNTDGAAIIDSISVSDATGLRNFQDFESVTVGATFAGIWFGSVGTPYGRYSSLRNNLVDRDPCNDNLATQIVFWGDPPIYPEPGYPSTPFCMGEGGKEEPCQDEMVVSPIIDLAKYSIACNSSQNGTIPTEDLAQLGGATLGFTVYRDLPFENLVFYNWAVRTVDESGCPGLWQDRGRIYYGDEQEYLFSEYSVGDLVGAGKMQIALRVVDLCYTWYLYQWIVCEEHTPTPWFDNVWLKRYKTSDPQWSCRDFDLFQDNFPSLEFDMESYVRADAAIDISNGSDIDPGDSIVVSCASPLAGGLAIDAGWPAIYLHIKASYIGATPLKPDLAGAQLAGNFGRYKSDDGVWTVIQGDTARTPAGPAVGSYMFDLNDSLFTRGYMIEYYFSAVDLGGAQSYLPRYAPARGQFYEWTCLPTLASEVLYVDDFHGIGSFEGIAELYWRAAFCPLWGDYDVDRYDVNAPTSYAANGPGSRAKNYQMTTAYGIVVWDSGDLSSGTISDGSGESDKSNDAQMLIDWMNLSEHDCGLWICGDGIAEDLDGLSSSSASELRVNWCGVSFMNGSYYDLTGGLSGGVMNPLVKGSSVGIFYHGGTPDEFYAYGGCPTVNDFDVLERAANGQYALEYPDYGGSKRYAAIQSVNPNSGSYDVRTMWWGFSFMWIRDGSKNDYSQRQHLGIDVLQWMQMGTWMCTEAEKAPAAYALGQCHPNPFNPSTTFSYAMKEKGRVTLKVYGVTGALVRTLVDEVKPAGSYTVTWDGTSDRGGAVASGVYFYRMDTKGFTSTKKMVLLR